MSDTPSFRALCAELACSVELLLQMRNSPRPMQITEDRLKRARAALATPEPEPPTNDELNALWNCCGTADEYGHHEGNIFDFARAALERWGHG